MGSDGTNSGPLPVFLIYIIEFPLYYFTKCFAEWLICYFQDLNYNATPSGCSIQIIR